MVQNKRKGHFSPYSCFLVISLKNTNINMPNAIKYHLSLDKPYFSTIKRLMYLYTSLFTIHITVNFIIIHTS